MIRMQAMGDQALLVNWEQRIDPEVNQQVIHLASALQLADQAGIRFWIPAYSSLTVGYDPQIWQRSNLENFLHQLAGETEFSSVQLEQRNIRIPVCYEGEFAPDMEEVEGQTGLKAEQIISLHTETSFQIYMLGFIPGFSYMGILPTALHCKRKQTPRLRVPTGSVGLAGSQTGIYPSEAPGGWQLIGRTPIPALLDSEEQPFLFSAGDQVLFHSISAKAFQEISEKVKARTFDFTSLYV